MSLQEDFTAELQTLMQPRDAFEEVSGDPANPRSKAALEMGQTLREWKEEFGLEQLERYAQAHQDGLEGDQGLGR